MTQQGWLMTAMRSWLGAIFAFAAFPAAAQVPEPVSLRLNWTVLAYHMPFYLAQARGYYKDVNLAVTISEGKGSGSTIQLVAAGADTFGFADSVVVAKAIGTGVPVKVVLGIIQKSEMSIVVPVESDIKKPTDLKGKRISNCPASSPGVMFPAYLNAIGLSATDVTVLNVQCGPSVYQTVAQKQVDGVAGYTPASRAILKAMGVPEVRALEYSQAGILIPSQGIVASTKVIEAKPDVVRRFLAATIKGWTEAKQDPDAAVAATVAAIPLLKGKEMIYKAEFEETLKYLDTPNTKGKPFGWQSLEDWTRAEGILTRHMDFKPQPSAQAYFTNDFLPK
jgi:NitT/TauT family transport system substrate-binding protein